MVALNQRSWPSPTWDSVILNKSWRNAIPGCRRGILSTTAGVRGDSLSGRSAAAAMRAGQPSPIGSFGTGFRDFGTLPEQRWRNHRTATVSRRGRRGALFPPTWSDWSLQLITRIRRSGRMAPTLPLRFSLQPGQRVFWHRPQDEKVFVTE